MPIAIFACRAAPSPRSSKILTANTVLENDSAKASIQATEVSIASTLGMSHTKPNNIPAVKGTTIAVCKDAVAQICGANNSLIFNFSPMVNSSRIIPTSDRVWITSASPICKPPAKNPADKYPSNGGIPARRKANPATKASPTKMGSIITTNPS